MSDRAFKLSLMGALHLFFVLILTLLMILTVQDSFSPYATDSEQNFDIIATMVMAAGAAFNATLFIANIIRIGHVLRNDEAAEEDDDDDWELTDAYDQLEAAGLTFEDDDEIIRFEDDELYLCLGNHDRPAGIDLKLSRNDDGIWQLSVPGRDDLVVPVTHVVKLQDRIRRNDDEIVNEIEALAPATA